ncbi:hypothetical protein RFI_18816, partial [Reticulomyxa filosa]
GLLSFFACGWVVDTMARAEGLIELASNTLINSSSQQVLRPPPTTTLMEENNKNWNTKPNKGKEHSADKSWNEIQNRSIEDSSRSMLLNYLSPMASSESVAPKYGITSRKFELNQLVGMFAGQKWRRAYEICTCLFTVGACWGFVVYIYTTVFGSALARQIGISGLSSRCNIENDTETSCDELYLVYVGVFALVIIPLSLMDVTEQKYLQVLLMILRYVLIFLMSITSICLLYSDYIPTTGAGYELSPNSGHTARYGKDNKSYQSNVRLLFSFVSVAGKSIFMFVCIRIFIFCFVLFSFSLRFVIMCFCANW